MFPDALKIATQYFKINTQFLMIMANITNLYDIFVSKGITDIRSKNNPRTAIFLQVVRGIHALQSTVEKVLHFSETGDFFAHQVHDHGSKQAGQASARYRCLHKGTQHSPHTPQPKADYRFMRESFNS